MPDESSDNHTTVEAKRPWYAVKRIQGLALMAVGFAMLAHPATAPHAGTVIGVGAAWAGVGQVAKLERDAKK